MVVSPIILLGASMMVAAVLVSSFVPAEPITTAFECFVDDVRPRCPVPAASLLFLSVFVVTVVDKSASISISVPSPFNSIFIFPSIVSIVVLPVLVVVVVVPVLVAAPTMFDVAESSFIRKFDRHSR